MSFHHHFKLNTRGANLIYKWAMPSALVFIAALAISARAFRHSESGVRASTPVTSTAHESSPPPQQETAKRTERVQVVRFTLYDVGIVPQHACAQPGLVTIAVEDLSGGTTGLIVERDEGRQTGTRTGEVRRKERKRRGQEELRLEPGRYQLYMADRPDNRAELIVEP